MKRRSSLVGNRIVLNMAGQKRTADGEIAEANASTEAEVVGMPQKKFYRSRAHCNPLSHNDSFD